jgi:hypothetical protein
MTHGGQSPPFFLHGAYIADLLEYWAGLKAAGRKNIIIGTYNK